MEAMFLHSAERGLRRERHRDGAVECVWPRVPAATEPLVPVVEGELPLAAEIDPAAPDQLRSRWDHFGVGHLGDPVMWLLPVKAAVSGGVATAVAPEALPGRRGRPDARAARWPGRATPGLPAATSRGPACAVEHPTAPVRRARTRSPLRTGRPSRRVPRGHHG